MVEQGIKSDHLVVNQAVLEAQYGALVGQVIYSQLNAVEAAKANCLDILQLSEIAERLRTHTRSLIANCRVNDARQHNCSAPIIVFAHGQSYREEIAQAYALYKHMNHMFHDQYDTYMNTIAGGDQNNARRWYNDTPDNDAGYKASAAMS